MITAAAHRCLLRTQRYSQQEWLRRTARVATQTALLHLQPCMELLRRHEAVSAGLCNGARLHIYTLLAEDQEFCHMLLHRYVTVSNAWSHMNPAKTGMARRRAYLKPPPNVSCQTRSRLWISP